MICLNSHEWKMFVMLSFMCYDCYYKATTKFLASEIWSVILVLYYKCSGRSVLIPHQKLSKIVFYSSLTKRKGAGTSS